MKDSEGPEKELLYISKQEFITEFRLDGQSFPTISVEMLFFEDLDETMMKSRP